MRQYLAVVTELPAQGAIPAAAAASTSSSGRRALLQVFDLRNKLLAGSLEVGRLYGAPHSLVHLRTKQEAREVSQTPGTACSMVCVHLTEADAHQLWMWACQSVVWLLIGERVTAKRDWCRKQCASRNPSVHAAHGEVNPVSFRSLHSERAPPSQTLQVEGGIKALLPGDVGIAALATDGRVVGLKERDLASRLDLLFAKGLHGVALNVAEAAHVRIKLPESDRTSG